MAFSTVFWISSPICSRSHHAAAVPATSAPLRRRRNVLAMASSEVNRPTMNSENDIVRPVTANFPPSLWDGLFSSFNMEDFQLSDTYTEEIKVLKEETRNMIVSGDSKLSEKLVLIDTIERLGLSYHFENEIQQQLTLAFNGHFKLDPEEEDDLFIIALQFRLLRQRLGCTFLRLLYLLPL
ncbi:hypothetical protein ACP275_01G036300 [Erythranthe tilingii]